MTVRNGAPDAHILPILGVLLIAVGPHLFRLPLWVVVWCLFFWGYIHLSRYRRLPWPGRPARILFAAVGITGVMATFGHVSGRDVGVAMLAILLGVKPFEIDSHRDRMVTIFLAYFQILSNLLYEQSLVMAGYLFGSVLATTAVLIHLNHFQEDPWSLLRRASVIMMQALPIMAIMFLLFPRLPGSLFHLPQPAIVATGFTDSMSPGDISQLARSSETAFRAEFDDFIPPRRDLYWRGLVLWRFDGVRWDVGYRIPMPGKPPTGRIVTTYDLMMEPHGRRWLFALDMPDRGTPEAGLFVGTTFLLREDLKKRQRFSLSAVLGARVEALAGEKTMALQLPPKGNPKARDLAREWAEQSDTAEEIVGKALRYFQEQPFYYTLSPQPLGEDRIDDFLFRARRGFCEHYASAFVFLMRAAGLPARVVVGYQGGELNPVGNYLIVRQSDAHAWAEVALPDRGWVRVDPTAAVAPDRVERGMEAALSPEEIGRFMDESDLGALSGAWKFVRLRWDRANFVWNRWVLDYNHQRQRGLLEGLGIRTTSFLSTARILVYILVGAGILIVGVAAGFALRRRGVPRDRLRNAYDRFCARMSRIGLPRPPYLGPREYEDLIIRSRPDLARHAGRITDLYARLRYGRTASPAVRKEFEKQVRNFRPSKRP